MIKHIVHIREYFSGKQKLRQSPRYIQGVHKNVTLYTYKQVIKNSFIGGVMMSKIIPVLLYTFTTISNAMGK